MPVTAAILAVYGWAVITRIAKYRAASDLYNSAILLLEQLESDGVDAWSGDPKRLDEYTEQKLLFKITAFEQRVRLIRKFYNRREDNDSHIEENISALRKYLTIDAYSMPCEKFRKNENHRITSEMICSLLESNYEYINKNPWLPWPQ